MFTGLATKYRPKKFKQIIGQPDIPVIKAVIGNKDSLPPLLVFCGPSGVGKTTTARIVASALNCKSPVSGEPCGTCGSCQAIRDGSFPNVYELDAASHGTADHLRDIVTKSYLSSISTKLFILDEAQSISSQGWNVLLKVLEEPPPECMFILITSEPRKIPSKIRTRALKFNFKSISPSKLSWYLEQLCAHKNIVISSQDIELITYLSEGSIRDALMMLDQCTASNKSAVELFSDKDLSIDLITSIIHNDYSETLHVINRWWGEVGDAKSMMSQLVNLLEKLVTIKSDGAKPESKGLQFLTDSLGSNKLVNLIVLVSDWFPQTYSKAQIIMLATKMTKEINGHSVVMPLETNAVKNSSEEQAINLDQINDRLNKL